MQVLRRPPSLRRLTLLKLGPTRPTPTQGNVFTFLQQQGGRLPEAVAVPMILEPTMSALAYIHSIGMIHRWGVWGGKAPGCELWPACRGS